MGAGDTLSGKRSDPYCPGSCDPYEPNSGLTGYGDCRNPDVLKVC